ncbi:hypothetical protein [Egbenema bharatensis]|uniref:hypothetical protein n=1 Tax=Egbenema bharatensis TaxID=3463334 RepID=UPI003A8C60FA
MTGQQLKRLILVAITLVMVALLGSSLLGSLGEPQVNDRLQLYQTDLASGPWNWLIHRRMLHQKRISRRHGMPYWGRNRWKRH